VAVGGSGSLLLPLPSPLPEVVTRSPAAGTLSAADLVRMVEQLHARLLRSGWVVDAFAERSVGSVAIGNTRGVASEYPHTQVGLGAAVSSVDGRLSCRVHQVQAAPPSAGQVDALVAELSRLLDPPPINTESATRSARVWFGPRAVRALLTPILARLVGERWLEERDRWPSLDDRLTLIDDPHQPERPGSRPIDDDGVPTRRLTLIGRGRVVTGVLDLATGSRHLVPTTGHGWRRGPAGSRPGFTNLLLAAGEDGDADLAAAAGSGVLVRDFQLGPSPNPETGVFRAAAPWAYQLSRGEIIGRLEGVVLAGNVFQLLGPSRLMAVGRDREWLGAALLPSLVVDGVGLTFR
jgi:PmbA protein